MKSLLLISFLTASFVEAQSQIILHDWKRPRMRYCLNPTFSTTEIKNVSGNYADAPGNTDTSFSFKIYFPDTAKDNLSKRPFILLIHGGEYQEGSLTLDENLSLQFALRGFVAATINYRLSQWQTGNCLSSDTSLLWQNYYRSIQDTRAAVRYFVHYAADFGIDTSWIFIGGQSSGGITSLAVAFQDQQETDVVTGPLNLGDIDHADNSLTDYFTIKGVLNELGAIKYTSDIDSNETIPVISFHAYNDPLVPYGFNHLASGQCGNAYQFVNGSSKIQERLLSFGICAELDSSPSDHHVNLVGDEYVVKHASCFFNSVMSNDCHSDTFTIEDNISPNCCVKSVGIIHRTFRTAQYGATEIFYSQHQLVIDLEEEGNGFSAEVYNVWGMKVTEFDPLITGENIFPFELSTGIYFIALRMERVTITTKQFVVPN